MKRLTAFTGIHYGQRKITSTGRREAIRDRKTGLICAREVLWEDDSGNLWARTPFRKLRNLGNYLPVKEVRRNGKSVFVFEP